MLLAPEIDHLKRGAAHASLFSNEIILCWVEPSKYMGTGQRFQTSDGYIEGFCVITNIRVLFFFATHLVRPPAGHRWRLVVVAPFLNSL